MREKSWDLRRRSQRAAMTSGVVARRAHGALILLLVLMVAAAAPASELEEPCTGESDWMRLTSGEWLKGDLKRMRRRKIEFKSKEMKSLKFDWSKVDRFCSGGVARFINDAHVVFEGKGRVEADYLIVETERGAVRLPRDDLLAILPGRDREIRKWGFTLGAGVDANVGNTNQTAINANMSIRREDRLTRGEIAYNGTFGTADGDLNVNRHRIDNSLDWFFSRYLYWSLLDMPVVYDQFQNIAIRLTPSTGLGWQIFDRPRFELSLELGAGYQYTSYLSTERFQDSTANDAALRLSVDLDWDILSDLNLKLSHDTLFIPSDIGQTSNYTRATLKYEITDLFSLETTLVHNRIWEPVADVQGDVPDSDDFQLIVGLSIELQ